MWAVRLSNYWNIYWILIRSLIIGNICGIFLQILSEKRGPQKAVIWEFWGVQEAYNVGGGILMLASVVHQPPRPSVVLLLVFNTVNTSNSVECAVPNVRQL